ncbi:RNA methyltransferase [Pelagicoccus sp. SDUM812005]|uniref:TrmH family RNA methyltransferase n=1 Tax=Pelagicoccus sp. SDUM812005 TaxID=3041257 RepID=UPI00280F920B|nr:RNA methyltransferase [Pelagicoccus sp. SDUM812005]MDQ8183354.1 RNA methyltransferase [Pelagicoccus sp. SDUM812005]
MKKEQSDSPWGRKGPSESRGPSERRDFKKSRGPGKRPEGRSKDRPQRGGRPPAKREAPKPEVIRTAQGDQWLEPVCGVHAVGSLFHCKPFIVERLYFDAELAPMFGEICKFLAGEKKPYNQVEFDELTRQAGTTHHGGVVAIARRRQPEVATTKAAEFWAKEGMPLLILDGVQSPENLGRLARASAYFGVEKFLIAASRKQARPNEVAYRAARGGLDMVDLRLVDNVPSFLKGVRKTHFVIGVDLEGLPLPEHMAICPEEDIDKPVAIVIGNEESGLLDSTKQECAALVGIPGSGAIDRLDVAMEAALLLQKYLVEA